MSSKSVFIVDDSEADQFLTKLQLEEYSPGMQILQAYDGEEALSMLDEIDRQPDVIFLDVNMPRMGGIEFLKHYSRRSANSSVIMMLTSSEESCDRETSTAYDFVKGYFIKPLDSAELGEKFSLYI